MSNIDKPALREEFKMMQECYSDPADRDRQVIYLAAEALLDELEAKDTQIDNLTVERDALREGAMGDAKHSNTRAAADIYFQLVEECEIPAGGSLVEHVSELRERTEAAEKRVAELERFINQSCYVFDGRDADISDAYIDAATSGLMPKIVKSTEDESCRYCSDGSYSGLPGGACEHCMGTGLDNPAAGIKLQIEGE